MRAADSRPYVETRAAGLFDKQGSRHALPARRVDEVRIASHASRASRWPPFEKGGSAAGGGGSTMFCPRSLRPFGAPPFIQREALRGTGLHPQGVHHAGVRTGSQ